MHCILWARTQSIYRLAAWKQWITVQYTLKNTVMHWKSFHIYKQSHWPSEVVFHSNRESPMWAWWNLIRILSFNSLLLKPFINMCSNNQIFRAGLTVPSRNSVLTWAQALLLCHPSTISLDLKYAAHSKVQRNATGGGRATQRQDQRGAKCTCQLEFQSLDITDLPFTAAAARPDFQNSWHCWSIVGQICIIISEDWGKLLVIFWLGCQLSCKMPCKVTDVQRKWQKITLWTFFKPWTGIMV